MRFQVFYGPGKAVAFIRRHRLVPSYFNSQPSGRTLVIW